MPLQTASYALQFQGGLDSKTDSKQIGYSKLLDLQNAVFTKNTTLVKRNGYKALSTSVDGSSLPYSNPQGLGKRGDDLVLFAGGHAYSHRASTDTWSDIGAVQSIVASGDPVARTGSTQTASDVAINDGVMVAAWEDSRGGVWLSVLEATGHRVLMQPTKLDQNGTRPRCLAVGNVLHVLYVVGARLWVAIINPSSPSTVVGPSIVTEDLPASNPAYDAVATFDSFNATIRPGFLAWATSEGSGIGVKAAYLHPSGALGAPSNGLPVVARYAANQPTGPVACGFATAETGSAQRAIVVWADTNLNYRIVSTSTLATTSATGLLLAGSSTTWNRVAVEFGAPTVSAHVAWWAVEVNGVSADVNFVQSGSVDSAGNVSVASVQRGHGLATRAYNDNGEVFVGIVHPVLFFPYVAMVQLSSATVTNFGGGAPPFPGYAIGTSTPGPSALTAQARLLPGQSNGLPTRSILPSAIPMGLGVTGATSRIHGVPLPYRIQLSGTSGTQFSEVGILFFQLDHEHNDAYRTAELGRGMYLAGALVQHYDGRRFAEADFHAAPDTAAGGLGAPSAFTDANGHLTLLATYNYIAVYEEIDAQGELHPGAASVPLKVTLTGGNNSVIVPLPTCRLTGKRWIRISVYRSPANQTGDPQSIPYYRVSSTDPTTFGVQGFILNDVTTDLLSFTDEMSDAVLITQEPLYTNGGILSNDPAPSGGGIIAGGKSRLFGTDPIDPNLVLFSQQFRDDTAAEWPVSLSMRTDPYGGSVVGLCVMDSGVFAFKDTAIYVADGPGPDADGGRATQNAFTPWALVTSDVGCKASGSICQTPIGITFQSQKGIKLLGRDRQVVDIGADVYAFNSQTITRATLLPDRHQVVFLTDSGSTLLWDYLRGQWSRFTNHEGFDAVVIDNAYYYLRTDGRVFAETPGVYADDNRHIPMTIETAWIKMAGYLQGWQKVLRADVIGNYVSSHTLNVRYRLNYNPAYSAAIPLTMNTDQTASVYGAGLYGAGPYGGDFNSNTTRYQRGMHLNKRCQAISFQFSDVEPTTTFGGAFELSELLLTGGTIGVRYPMGAARSQ